MKYWLKRKANILLHKFNLHHTNTHEVQGDVIVRCDWCGLMYVKERKGYKKQIDTIGVGCEYKQNIK